MESSMSSIGGKLPDSTFPNAAECYFVTFSPLCSSSFPFSTRTRGNSLIILFYFFLFMSALGYNGGYN